MEDLLSIVVLILYFVVAGTAGKNKKKKKSNQKNAGRREVQFEQAFEQVIDAMRRNARTQATGTPKPETVHSGRNAVDEGEDPCHEPMLSPRRETIRFETVSQEEMDAAGEGEDPCHTGSVLMDSPLEHSPIFDTEDTDAFARDVLRGVAMSEILARPAQRRGAGVKRRV